MDRLLRPWNSPGKNTGLGCHFLLQCRGRASAILDRVSQAGKVHLVKAVVFPVVMYGCESWTVKKAER